MRIGHGFDAHRFCEGDAVVIGGVQIPHDRGLAAHSDGDVLIHAICRWLPKPAHKWRRNQPGVFFLSRYQRRQVTAGG